MAGSITIEIKVIGIEKTAAFFSKLPGTLTAQQPALFLSLGEALVQNVKNRIRSSDNGAWAPASKWLRAKTGQSKVLKGTEKYVKMTVTPEALTVGGDAPGWTLSAHHSGFENQPASPAEERDEHGRVIIPLKDPSALNLYTEYRKTRAGKTVPRASVFAFVPLRPGHTPARKIWPTQGETEQIAIPIASRWLQKVVNEAMA